MSLKSYKVTITEHDYRYTTYTAWVQGASRDKAVAKAAALAGQEKYRREHERSGREPGVGGLLEPDVRVEPCDLDEYWEKRDTVEVGEL